MNNEVVEIGANCVVRIGNRFFLLVEIEVEAINLEEFVFIRISEREFRTLIRAGVQRCTIRERMPRNNAEFICVLIENGQAFLVFDVENNQDEAVLVRISLTRAEELIRRGAMRCTVINR
ncbi:hypothetical protein P9D43_26445 [Neobacillus niacini]|uniref:hypothetical protein n=1 Tax=Neobacillus niacini TaxID=86668 RepID=UPI0007ABF1D8|nr:hypothetical protein [Neobacillus niacini]MEC1525544.1 hypothetical protein [Neobacillus niacini]